MIKSGVFHANIDSEISMRGTREKILQKALKLFAGNGYEAVSVSEIAGALGITKGALYRHYINKRDIFDSILSEMERRDAERAAAFDLPEGTLHDMPEKYRAASMEKLIDFCKAQFDYWTRDEFASDFRKLLTIEQYRSDEMMSLYRQYLAGGPLRYIEDLLSAMGCDGPLEKAEKLYAHMFFCYSLYDSEKDKDGVRQALFERLDDMSGTFLR